MPKRKDQDGLYQRGDSPFWWASYTDASGARTRRSTETADRKDAEALLAKWKLAAYQEKHWDAPPSHTFDEMMLNYLAETTNKRSHARDLDAARHLYQTFSGLELSAVTAAKVRQYVQARRTVVAPATVNRELCLLSVAFNHARHYWDWVAINPVPGRKLKTPPGRVRWLSAAEAERLMNAATAMQDLAEHLPDFIRLALHTGCRKQELLGLEWMRVDWSSNQFRLEPHHTKTGQYRVIPLNAMARQSLLNRARFRAEHCPASPWVFSHADGSRLQDVKKSFHSACRRAGIVDFRIHDLRHTCAAWLVSAGVALPEVRDLLGHASITMTERYAHLAPENVRAAVAVLESASRSSHVNDTLKAKQRL